MIVWETLNSTKIICYSIKHATARMILTATAKDNKPMRSLPKFSVYFSNVIQHWNYKTSQVHVFGNCILFFSVRRYQLSMLQRQTACTNITS